MYFMITMKAKNIQQHIRGLANSEIAAHSAGFFKTGVGQYGEGDRFLGIRIPVLRKLLREYREVALPEILEVLHSCWHEERLFALLLLVDRFERGEEAVQRAVYEAYLAHTAFINNWDLVDVSAHKVVGAWLFDKDRAPLHKLAGSGDLWEQRIAIIATYWFIRRRDFADTLAISSMLLNHPHDLIHKAVGWMLREIGKIDQSAEEVFLRQHYHKMPRTMLRYAIERFPKPLYLDYLHGRVESEAAV